MAEREILEKLIQDGKDAEKKLADLEVTYSIGDRFLFRCYDSKQKLIMSKMGDRVGLIELSTGQNWGHNNNANVKDEHCITEKEMNFIWNSDSCTRYWDSQKKVKS